MMIVYTHCNLLRTFSDKPSPEIFQSYPPSGTTPLGPPHDGPPHDGPPHDGESHGPSRTFSQP